MPDGPPGISPSPLLVFGSCHVKLQEMGSLNSSRLVALNLMCDHYFTINAPFCGVSLMFEQTHSISISISIYIYGQLDGYIGAHNYTY